MESTEIDNEMPVPAISHCAKPCGGKTPCLRICPIESHTHGYPYLSSSNLKACIDDVCNHNISSEVAKTLFGDSEGNVLSWMIE